MRNQLLLVVFITTVITSCAKEKSTKAEKIGKKITDYNDVDVEKLLDQWNENDEEYNREDSDDPRHKEPPKINMEEVLSAGGDKEKIMMASKKGKPMMIFANLAGNPTRQQTETISGIWQTSLRNAQIQVQRYVISDNRVLLQLDDGSKAWEIKDYLVQLDNCESVSFENMDFPGKGAKNNKVEL